MAANFFDQFDPSSAKPAGGGNYFDQFDPGAAKPAPSGGTTSDLAKSLKVGVQRLPGMVTGLADLPVALATGARPFTKAADALGDLTGFQPGKWADETKFSQGYEQGKKAVDEAWKDGGAGDIALSYLKNPGYTANQVVESLPSMVAGGLAGRALAGVGSVANVAAKAGGVGPAAPGLLARAVGEKMAAPVAAGIGEGAVTAGQQMQQYRGEDQQRNALASLGAGTVTGALGVGAGRVANKLGLETAETAIVNAGKDVAAEVPMSAKRRILGGMVSESILQELPQSAQEQMWQNYADGKPLMEGVLRQGVEGAIAGGVMGAGANVSGESNRSLDRHRKEQEAADALRSQEPTTSPGAADPHAPVPPGAAPVEVPDLQTSLGAGVQRDGLDFTREVDTSGLSLEDPAEVARARAATMDYQPGDTTPQWDTAPGVAQERQPGLEMPAPEFDTGGLGLESRSRALTPSQQMGIDPAAGPLSKMAAAAVDAGAAQEAQFLGATGRDLQVRRTSPGVTDESNVIDVQGRVVEDRSIGTPRRIETRQRLGGGDLQQLAFGANQSQSAPNAEPKQRTRSQDQQAPVAPLAVATIPQSTSGAPHGSQADQAQQAIPEPAQAGAAPAGQPTAPGLTNGAPAQDVGAPLTPAAAPQGQAQAAGVAQAVAERPANWRTSMLKAGPAAKAMGIDPRGKRLAQVVAEIDAADARRAGVRQDGADLAAGKIDRQWSAFAPETGTLGVPRADMPQIKAEHRGALVNFLKARGIDSRADEVPANDLKPTQAEFSPAKVEKARAFQGGDRSILVSADGYVVDGHHQWLAKRANGEPVKVIRLQAPIRQVLAQTAEFPSTASARGAQTTQGAADAATPRDLRLADERAPGAAVLAQDRAGRPDAGAAPAVGAEQRAGGDTAQPAPAVRAAVPDAVGAGQPAAGVAQKLTARQAQEEGAKQRAEAKKEKRKAARQEVAAETGLRVGSAPGSAEPVTVRDGTVYMGKYEAVNYDTGEPVTVPKGSTREDVAQALKDAGALSSRTRLFGLGEQGGEVMFSRSPATQSAYESRIDALFAGEKPRLQGARVLDRSDMLAFLGLGDGPVNLAEGKVTAGQDNHPHMTAAVWKKIPEWLENPALVFDSDTSAGRLVFIAPELVNGSPVRIILEPNAGGGAKAHLLVNAYDAQGSSFRRWEQDGLLRYVDRNKYAHVSGTFQPRLTGLPGDRGRGRILTDKQFTGWRRANNPAYSQSMSQELARKLLAIPRPATKESVRAAVRELVNGMGMLPNRLGRVVVATASEIKRDWDPLIGSVQLHAEQDAKGEKKGAAQGFYDPKTRTVFLIADNIKAGEELGVVAHELMHKHGQAVLGEEGWNRLHGAIEGWATAPEGSQERSVYDEAAARVRKSRPDDVAEREYSSQELFPYAVQVALEQGVRPNLLAKPGTVARWLGQVKAALRDVWAKIVGKPDSFKSQDLVNLAYGIAQRENPEHAGELDGAVLEGARGNVLQELAATDALFKVPKSPATTVEGIAADISKDIKVRKVQGIPGRQEYEVTMPSGDKATLSVRSPNPYGESVYGFDLEDGEMANMELERPGENPQDVPRDMEDVWIDASHLSGQGDGMLLYALAANYAHNTGRIFIGDPAGLSDQALRRRSEQMLSSALKFGTTAHLAPHPRQVRGDSRLGVPPLKWVHGDDLGNIRRLVDLNLIAMENAGESSITYDPEHGTYLDSNGTPIDRDGISLLADSGYGRNAGAGSTTLARRAVLDSLLRGTGEAGRGGNGRSDALLESLLGQSHRHPAATEGLFYSRSVAAAPATGDYTPAQQSASERAFGVQKKLTLAERAREFRQNLGTKLRQGLVDQFAPIKEVSDKAYMLARMSKGSDGALEAALLYGKIFLRDGVYDVDIKDGGFAKVLASLKGEHDRFLQWVAAIRAERLKAEGKENLMSNEDISDLKTLNAGNFADGTPRFPVYAKALQELNAFQESNLKMAMESGLIDQTAFDIMRDQPYVPFYRLMEEEGGMRGPRFSSGLVNQQAWKKLKGGTQQINGDLLANVLLNWSSLYAAAARNRAALETMAAAESMGIAYKVDADTKGAVKVMRDGVAEHWAVEDPYLLDAISAMSYAPGGIVKAMAPFKRLLTFGVTVNPTFKIRNLIRDSLSAIAQSDLSYNPLDNVAKGWKATGKDSQIHASMLASGGIIKFGTQEDTNRVRAQIEKLGGQVLDKDGWGKLKGQMQSLWDAYAEFGDRTENVNRAALYERLIAKGHSHAEASFMARDLMDFSMSGKWELVRFLTQTVPFLNARMQGLYKLGRAAKEDPRRFAAMAGAVSLASLGLLAAYGDDDDWKKREDWDRDNYWWFKIGDTAFRIPKPFEVGAIGTLAERTAELMMSDEMTGKRFGQRISDMVFNTFAMDPTPQFIKPFIDVYANKDSFSGRPIEGMADERLRPQDRYNERTSEAARLLGSWGLPDPVRLAKGEYAGLSPKQIDFLLRGYFGWLATVATTVTDAAARPMLDRGERPTMRMRDTFLAGNFVESLPTGSSRYVTTMYEQAKEVEQAWASYQAALKSGDVEKAREIQQDEAPKLRNRMAVESAKRLIAELGQQAKRIESNRLMPAEEKRRRLDEIEARKHEAARRVAPTS